MWLVGAHVGAQVELLHPHLESFSSGLLPIAKIPHFILDLNQLSSSEESMLSRSLFVEHRGRVVDWRTSSPRVGTVPLCGVIPIAVGYHVNLRMILSPLERRGGEVHKVHRSPLFRRKESPSSWRYSEIDEGLRRYPTFHLWFFVVVTRRESKVAYSSVTTPRTNPGWVENGFGAALRRRTRGGDRGETPQEATTFASEPKAKLSWAAPLRMEHPRLLGAVEASGSCGMTMERVGMAAAVEKLLKWAETPRHCPPDGPFPGEDGWKNLSAHLLPALRDPSAASPESLSILEAALRSPWSLLLSRVSSPNSPSLSSYGFSSPQIISVASSGLPPTSPYPPCPEDSRTRLFSQTLPSEQT
ncbi:uncharacterized protein LOC128850014 [Cuculus canorus]|uniref:uncharacterized protein LOC128850014 n=1 Tax=Cuculus canorus TaxID=55661 RepID=UPI0023AA5401|nr:uncharacterized protein LOC128850014 [Cuculus canorus]